MAEHVSPSHPEDGAEDFLAVPQSPTQPLYGAPVAPGTTPAAPSAAPNSNRRNIARGVGLVAVGALAGGLAAGLITHQQSSTAPSAATTGLGGPGAPQGATGSGDSTDNGSQFGQGQAPAGGFDGAGGGLDGEQRVQGTLSAVNGSTITVTTSSGKATYTVTDTTEIIRNGATAKLSDLKVGDPVFVHVYPSGNQMLVERLFAGTMLQQGGPQQGGPGFGPPPGMSGGTGGAGTGTGTTT